MCDVDLHPTLSAGRLRVSTTSIRNLPPVWRALRFLDTIKYFFSVRAFDSSENLNSSKNLFHNGFTF